MMYHDIRHSQQSFEKKLVPGIFSSDEWTKYKTITDGLDQQNRRDYF